MRFLSLVWIDETTCPAPSERMLAEMGELMEQMTREGVLVQTAGLAPSSEGVRLRLRRGRVSTLDGPFAESKEVVGGYALLEAPDMAAAIAHTRRFLDVHGEECDVDCELRALMPEGECGGPARG